MRPSGIKKAVLNAKRFIELAKPLLDMADASHPGDYLGHGTKDSGALRRASMELTRSLADMRKG